MADFTVVGYQTVYPSAYCHAVARRDVQGSSERTCCAMLWLVTTYDSKLWLPVSSWEYTGLRTHIRSVSSIIVTVLASTIIAVVPIQSQPQIRLSRWVSCMPT
jgi:hypothetical protein